MKLKQKAEKRAFIRHPSSLLLAEGVGVEPTGAFKLRQFSGLLGVPLPNLPECWRGRPDLNREEQGWSLPVWRLAYAPSSASGRTRTSTLALASRSSTGCCRAFPASDARNFFGVEGIGKNRRRRRRDAVCCRTRDKTKTRRASRSGRARSLNPRAHAAATRAAFVPSSYFGCQTTKRAGPLASPQEAGPLRSSLYCLFRDLGAGGLPAPAELTLIPATIIKRHAFESEGVCLNESAALYGV